MNTTTPMPRLITGQVMYLGPHIRSLGLGFSKIWRNGIDKNLYPYIQQCPALGEMFIPVQDIAVVLRELNFDYAHNMRGTTGRYVTFYRAIQQWLAQQRQKLETPSGTMKKETHA